MKRIAWWICGFVALVILVALALPDNSVNYHRSEFERIKTTYNDYRPSLADQIRGLGENKAKYEFHLQKLMKLGAVKHDQFVFTHVPYTKENSKRIWLAAHSNFPNAVMFTAPYHATNAPSYGVAPCVLNVWDVPSEMERWSNFVQIENYPKPY